MQSPYCATARLFISKRYTRAQQIRSYRRSYPQNDAASHLPRIARPSLWQSLVPRFLRRKTEEEKALAAKSLTSADLRIQRTGRTITILGLLVGSFAINVIALRRELVNYTRNTEVKLELLREVVKRVRAGEDVDVKKLLGTGDPEKEQEWEEMMKDLESYNAVSKKKKKSSSPGSTKMSASIASWFDWSASKGRPSQVDISDEPQPEVKETPRSPAFMM